jgi:hypothetical protein
MDSLFRCVAIMIDRWDRGILDCWGSVCESDDQIKDMIERMKSDYAFLEFYKAKKAHALTILQKAMELMQNRRYALPTEFHVWSHLFTDEKFDLDPDVPPFGADCAICGKAVKTSTQQGPCVVEELVVCHRCMKKRLACPVCGGKMKLTKCLITRDQETQRLEIRCPHCYDVINTPF